LKERSPLQLKLIERGATPAPERIGKYLIRRVLGKGAMGTVYEGFDALIERPVAIKTILAEHLASAASLSAVARFKA
jgi:serine/threonine-protein kinase